MEKGFQEKKNEQRTVYVIFVSKINCSVVMCCDMFHGVTVSNPKAQQSQLDSALSRCYFQVYRTDPGMGTTHPFPSVLREQILGFHNYANIC